MMLRGYQRCPDGYWRKTVTFGNKQEIMVRDDNGRLVRTEIPDRPVKVVGLDGPPPERNACTVDQLLQEAVDMYIPRYAPPKGWWEAVRSLGIKTP